MTEDFESGTPYTVHDHIGCNAMNITLQYDINERLTDAV